jgi:dephospho-CoA kinase
VVTARESTQLERIVARDGISEQAARERIAAQLPLADKQKRADHVLYNNGSPEALAAQVETLLEKLRADASA